MANIETQILSKNVFKPTVWKRYIGDIFSLNETSANQILYNSSNKPTLIILQSNSRLKSQTFRLHFWIQLYTKANDSRNNLSLIYKTHLATPSVKIGFVKGEALRLL